MTQLAIIICRVTNIPKLKQTTFILNKIGLITSGSKQITGPIT